MILFAVLCNVRARQRLKPSIKRKALASDVSERKGRASTRTRPLKMVYSGLTINSEELSSLGKLIEPTVVAIPSRKLHHVRHQGRLLKGLQKGYYFFICLFIYLLKLRAQQNCVDAI